MKTYCFGLLSILTVTLMTMPPVYGIINGDLVEDTDTYASYVSIREKLPDPSQSGDLNGCGGVLIANQWILTAAHCLGALFDSNDAHSRSTGKAGVCVNNNGEFAMRIEIDIEGIVKHPDHARYKGVDAALVPLIEDSTKYGAKVASIYMGGKNIGEEVTVVGMGYNEEDSKPGHIAHLRYYNSQVADDKNCHPSLNDYIPEFYMCIGTGNPNGSTPGSFQRTGYGDSGGPLYIRNSLGALQVAGIVSGGVQYSPNEPEKNNEYIRFTMDGAVLDWITETINPHDEL